MCAGRHQYLLQPLLPTRCTSSVLLKDFRTRAGSSARQISLGLLGKGVFWWGSRIDVLPAQSASESRTVQRD